MERSGFDLPFLADRARAARVHLGIELRPEAVVDDEGHLPLPGHASAHRARWYRHLHLDAGGLYRAVLAGTRESFALKPLARDLGLAVVEVDASRIHELPAAELAVYVASDASLARQLAERRWLDAGAHLDALVLAPARR